VWTCYLLVEPPSAVTNAGRLFSGDGSHNKIQLSCNIGWLPQLVNEKLPAKSCRGRRLILLTISGLFHLLDESKALTLAQDSTKRLSQIR